MVDGGKNGAVDSQKKEVYQKYLKYAETHLYYLPGNCIPEAIVLQYEGIDEIYGSKIIKPVGNFNAKQSVEKICQAIFQKMPVWNRQW